MSNAHGSEGAWHQRFSATAADTDIDSDAAEENRPLLRRTEDSVKVMHDYTSGSSRFVDHRVSRNTAPRTPRAPH